MLKTCFDELDGHRGTIWSVSLKFYRGEDQRNWQNICLTSNKLLIVLILKSGILKSMIHEHGIELGVFHRLITKIKPGLNPGVDRTRQFSHDGVNSRHSICHFSVRNNVDKVHPFRVSARCIWTNVGIQVGYQSEKGAKHSKYLREEIQIVISCHPECTTSAYTVI